MKEFEEAMSGESSAGDGLPFFGEETVNREDLMDLRRAFGNLQEEDRLIIGLSFFGGYTSEEIARMMKRKPGTVRSRQSRALARLREALAGTYGL